MKVLVVDDSSINVEICREILEDEFEVITAGDGNAAVEAAKRHAPDVILLDIILPGIDGYETCRRLRALPAMRRARIIMLSAKAMPSERAGGLKAGADAYITKPFLEAELLEVIRTTVRLRVC
jgi:CheY-like chemotaxis protein